MTIREAFNELCIQRQELVNKEECNTEEYKTNAEKASELYHKILNIIPEDKKNLVYELEEITTLMSSLSMDMTYKQGLKDGKELLALF